jgi:hypothetical protein
VGDIDVDQRIFCKQQRSAFSPQALVGLNGTKNLDGGGIPQATEQQVILYYFKVQIVFP